MKQLRRGYVDTSHGQQLHYRLAGDHRGAPLVLIHQSPSSGAMWEPILPELAHRGYFAIAPDLIGHGASDGPEALPTLHEYADGVWRVMDGLDVRRASLVGHHSGASIALVMATHQPRRVAALALWGVPLMTAERELRLGGEGQPDWDHAEEWICKRWVGRRAASGTGWTAEIGRRALLELLQAGPNSQWLHNAVARMPVEPYLPDVAQPTLTICGELDSLYAESETAATLLPNGRFEPMHGASLDVADQDGVGFVNLVDEFLLECGARSSR
ncbi:MAG: alpha/beta fold hydrolase [Chloroflexi bacterium]|nr:alpha/beta fold hydrolase [Chloroflexota bacterium]